MIKLKITKSKNSINKVKFIKKSKKNIFGTCLLLAVLTFILKYLVFNCKRCPDRCPAGCPAGPAEMSC